MFNVGSHALLLLPARWYGRLSTLRDGADGQGKGVCRTLLARKRGPTLSGKGGPAASVYRHVLYLASEPAKFDQRRGNRTRTRDMSNKEQARSYYFQGMRFEFSCSNAMASYLDGRFRMLPINGQYTETICFEFQAVADASQHAVRRPQGKGRPFYELAQGEASYFEERDEVYLSFGEGVRALCSPASDRVRFSSVESDPNNLFMASHLLLTILLVEILKRR